MEQAWIAEEITAAMLDTPVDLLFRVKQVTLSHSPLMRLDPSYRQCYP
jgi:hypothetical protein